MTGAQRQAKYTAAQRRRGQRQLNSWIPARLRVAMLRTAKDHRRSLTAEVQVALEAHVAKGSI